MNDQSQQSKALIGAVGDALRQIREELSGRIEDLSAKAAGQQELEQLQAHLDTATEATSKISSELKKLTASVPQADIATTKQVTKEVGALKDRLIKELDAIRHDKLDTFAAVEDLGTRLNGMLPGITRLSSDFQKLEDAVRLHKTSQAKVMNRIAEKVDASLKKSEENVNGLSEELTQLRDDHAQMSEWIKDLSDVMAQHKETVDASVEGRVQECYQSLRDLSAKLAGLESSTQESLSNTVEQTLLAGELDTLRREIEGVSELVLSESEKSSQLVEETKALSERIQEIRNTELADDLGRTREKLQELESRQDSYEGNWEAAITEARDEIQTLSQRVLQQYSHYETWKRGGAPYKIHALVRHGGGTWQAIRENQDEEPGPESDAWVLILNGVKRSYVEEIEGEPHQLSVGLELATGEVAEARLQVPQLKDCGTWDAEREYNPYDIVTKNGCRWYTYSKNQGEEPGKSKVWILLSMRGARGARGHKGEQGEMGPVYPIEKILTEWRQAEDAGDGVPVRQYRGGWVYGEAYSRGDVVQMSEALWIALRDNDGTSGPLAAGTSSDWALMLDAQGGGGGGGGGFQEAWDDGVPATSGDTILDFVGTGDTSISVSHVDPDRTVVTINSVPGGAGGGIVKGDPFVVGDITAVETDTGSGTIESIGVSGAALSGHLGDTNIHFPDANSDGNQYGRQNGAWTLITGEANTQPNDGGGVAIGKAKNGVTLPLRTLDASQFEFAGDLISVQSDAFETTGAVAAHISDAGDPHAAAGYLKDAPSDGRFYARRNGAWDDFDISQGVSFQFSTSTNVGSSPGVGFVQVDSATPSAVTAMNVSDVDVDGRNVRTHFLNIMPETEVRLNDDFDVTQSSVYRVTGRPLSQSGYVQIPLAYVSDQGGGVPANNAQVHLFAAVGGVHREFGFFKTVMKAGSVQSTDRKHINFIEGTNVTIDVADAPGSDRADITINSAGGGVGEANTQTNLGGEVELGLPKDGVDLPLRTLKSSDSSITIALDGDTVDFVAVGGAGEENVQTNRGGGAELGLPKDGVDLPLRTFISGDGSVTVTPIGDTLDIRSTGAGGGEANISTTPAAVGANEADINMAKVGVDLQKRKITGGTGIAVTQSADAITLQTRDSEIDHDALLNYDPNQHFDDVALDGDWYLRSNQAWLQYQYPNAAANSGFYGLATSGKSFSVLEPVLVRDAVPAPAGTLYSNWPDAEFDEIDPAAAYDLPDTDSVGPISSGYRTKSMAGASNVGYAFKFSTYDGNSDVGVPVQWSITNFRSYGNFNNDDRANARYSIHADNGGEPGAVLYDDTNFDWSNWLNDGTTERDVPANDPDAMLLANNTTYWLVSEQQNSVNPLVNTQVMTHADWITDPDGGFRGSNEYLLMDKNPGGCLFFNGVAWVNDSDAFRMRIDVKRQTSLVPPSNVYGVMLDSVTDSGARGRSLSYGIYIGNTTGGPQGETWADRDLLYVDPVSKQLTNVQPSDARDIILMGQVLRAAASDGALMVTASATGTRGLYMIEDVYDPREIRRDVYNLDFIDQGTLDADRVDVDDTDWVNIVGENVQEALNSIDPQLGGGAAPTTATFYTTHTYAVDSLADGASTLVPFYADVVAGQVVTLEAATFRLAGGTATFEVRVKGVAQAFTTAAGTTLTPSATAARDTVSTPPNLVQLDDIDINITAATSATGLSVTLTFQHVVTLS